MYVCFEIEVIKLKNKLEEHNEEDQDLHIVREAKSYPGIGEVFSYRI
jgi:hypothetical protein